MDDAAAAGKAHWNAVCMYYLVRFGPRYGYFVEPAKSHYICKAEDEDVAQEAFGTLNLEINFSCGKCYLGGFFGSEATQEQWIGGMVAKWTLAVESLTVIALKHPQTAYAGFRFSLQNELQYMQRVVADTGMFLTLLSKRSGQNSSPPSWG